MALLLVLVIRFPNCTCTHSFFVLLRQGPFASNDMRKWYMQKFFQETLPIRYRDGDFILLGELYPDLDQAFLIPPPPKQSIVSAPPGLAPIAGTGDMFDNFGVGVKGRAGSSANNKITTKSSELYDTFGVGVRGNRGFQVQSRELEKGAWSNFSNDAPLQQIPRQQQNSGRFVQRQYQNQVHNMASDSTWRRTPASSSTPAINEAGTKTQQQVPVTANQAPKETRTISADTGRSSKSKPPSKQQQIGAWGSVKPPAHVKQSAAPAPAPAPAPSPAPAPTPAPAPAPAPTRAPAPTALPGAGKTPVQRQTNQQSNVWNNSRNLQQSKHEKQQPKDVNDNRNKNSHGQQVTQNNAAKHIVQPNQDRNPVSQRRVDGKSSLPARTSSSTDESKSSPTVTKTAWASATRPQKSLAQIQKEQADEERVIAAERAKEEERLAVEAQAQQRTGVWGAQRTKAKSLSEIQREEEMLRKQAQLSRRNKPVQQKSSWAGLAAAGTPSAWHGNNRSPDKWPTVGSKQVKSVAAPAPAAPTIAKGNNAWPSLNTNTDTKSNNNNNLSTGSKTASSKPADAWRSVSTAASYSRQQRKPQAKLATQQQQTARQRETQHQPTQTKAKIKNVWGSKAVPAKSLADIQREEQSRQHASNTLSGGLAQMRNDLKSMLGIGGEKNHVQNGKGMGAWGSNTSSRNTSSHTKSLREIQADEERRRSQNQTGARTNSGGWAAKVSGSKSHGSTSSTVWGASARQVPAKSINEIMEEESRKASMIEGTCL